MKFSERYLLRLEKGDFPLSKLWFAENQSSYSAHGIEPGSYWFPHCSNTSDCISAIFLSLSIECWFTEEITNRIAKLAYIHRYSGPWKFVQELLEQADTIEKFLEIYLSCHSEDDLYGNFPFLIEKFLRKNRRAIRSHTQHGRVRYKQFHRGYDDKGSLLPQQKRGRNLPDPNPGEDRREFLIHPLLKKENREQIKNLRGTRAELTLPIVKIKKGGGKVL